MDLAFLTGINRILDSDYFRMLLAGFRNLNRRVEYIARITSFINN
jgi:hypothetical protein